MRKAFVNQMVRDGVAELERVDTEDQLADVLTKNASPAVYSRLLPLLGGVARFVAESRGQTFIGRCTDSSTAAARFCVVVHLEWTN